MKVLGILGSPLRDGNTEILLKAFLEGAAAGGAAVEEIRLRELKISPCLEIYHCFKDGTCPIKDDMAGLYDKLVAADVVVLASPIFFYNVSAQAKAMIDRTQALWARRYILKKDFPPGRQGILLAVGAAGLCWYGSPLLREHEGLLGNREDGRLKATKIIISSGKSYAVDKKAALQLGANAYLTKPYTASPWRSAR